MKHVATVTLTIMNDGNHYGVAVGSYDPDVCDTDGTPMFIEDSCGSFGDLTAAAMFAARTAGELLRERRDAFAAQLSLNLPSEGQNGA